MADIVQYSDILKILGPGASGPALGGERVAVRFRNLSLKDAASLVWLFVLSIIVGFAIRHLYPCYWWGPQTIYALADALMVAGVIGILLELVASKFLIERVSDDLAQRLVGRGLPTQLQGHIWNIVQTAIVRDHYVKVYSFSDPSVGTFRIVITITFEVRNYSESMQEYKPCMDEEASFLPEFLYLEYGIQGEEKNSLDEEHLKKTITTNAETKAKTACGEKIIKLKPVREDSTAVCDVTWRYAVTMPEEFSDVTAFRGATIGAKLRLDRIPPGFKFVSAGDGMLPHADESLTWEFGCPFIAGQHVRTWWFRRDRE